jgi:hypothetical protein
MRRVLAALTLCLTLLCPVALPVPPQPTTQTQSDPKVQTVCMTQTGKKYHRDGCRYSDADIAGRKFVMDLMRSAGAEVRIDAAGNIFASRPGREPSLPPVLFGSHVDSVPNGGNFDGDLGSLSAIQILRMLSDLSIVTRASAHGRRLGDRPSAVPRFVEGARKTQTFRTSSRRATIAYRTGARKIDKSRRESSPPTITIANGFCESLPIPVDIAAGNRPMHATSAVIIIGRSRNRDASYVAVTISFPSRRSLLMKE